MNSKQKKVNQSGLTTEEIHLYQTTKDERIKHAIEKKSLENEFDADSLDGWAESGYAINNLKKWNPKSRKEKSINTFRIYAISIIGLISTHLFFTYLTFLPPTQEQSQSKKIVTIEKTDIDVPNAIAQLTELPENKQINLITVKADFKKSKAKQEINKPGEEQSISLAKEEPIVMNHVASPQAEKVNTEALSTKTTGKEVYLSDLKLLDYRAYRSKPSIQTQQAILTGTPANESGYETSSETQLEWKNVDVPYIDYLEKTMTLFAKGSNKKALIRFEEILKTYPDDINALFYSGLCYYNLNEFDKAVTSFELCMKSKYANFNEEAEWYMAKSYLADKNITEARKLFEKISSSNGYYSKNAKTILINQLK